jgi:AcrR family transcriptional regulator
MAVQTRKERQKLRIMSYFIDATHEVIENEGVDAVTVRKVADLAGYNSATLYNYFNNLDHLIGYAAIKYLKDYYLILDDYIKEADNRELKYLKIWEVFCIHSYKRPKIFKAIFFLTPNDDVKEIFDNYFEIYPSDFGMHTEDLLPMLNASSIHDRNRNSLMFLVKEGIIDAAALDELNDMTILMYRGFLDKLINTDPEKLNKVKEIDTIISHIKRLIDGFRV